MAVIFQWIVALACIALSSPVLGIVQMWRLPEIASSWLVGVQLSTSDERYCGGLSPDSIRLHRQGQKVTFELDATGNNEGYVTVAICPTAATRARVTQDCFNSRFLQLSDRTGTSFMIRSRPGHAVLNYELPADLTCEHCVILLTYYTSSFWDPKTNTPPEIIYECADIKIMDDVTWQASRQNVNSYALTTTETTKGCRGTGLYVTMPNIDSYCVANCARGFCPSSHCVC